MVTSRHLRLFLAPGGGRWMLLPRLKLTWADNRPLIAKPGLLLLVEFHR